MKVLIIGGAGFLGNYLCKNCIDERYEVTVYDNLSKSTLAVLPPEVKLIKDEVENIAKYKKLIQSFDIIYYLAQPRLNEIESDDIIRKAIKDLKSTLDIIPSKTKFIFTSSCSVYGVNEEQVDESSPVQITSRCSNMKILSEDLIKEYKNDSWKIVRLSTLFGLGSVHRPDLMINSFTLDILNGKIELFDSNASRPHFHVADAAVALRVLGELKYSFKILNIGHKNFIFTKTDLVENIKNILKVKCKVEEFKTKDSRSYSVIFNKFDKLTSFYPQSFESAIKSLKPINEIINASLESYDKLTKYYLPNTASKTWYIKEEEKFQIPRTWGWWNVFDEQYNLFEKRILRTLVTPDNFLDHDIKYLTKEQTENKKHLYIVHIFNADYFRTNKNLGLNCVDEVYLDHLRKGQANIVFICTLEGYSGQENNKDFETIERWINNKGIPGENVHYITGNLIGPQVAKSKKVTYNVIPICLFDSWVPLNLVDTSKECTFNPIDEKYLYLSYARNPRDQRIALCSRLLKNNLLDKGRVSLGKFEFTKHLYKLDDIEVIKKLSQLVPIEIDRTLEYNLAADITLPDYENTFISVINETLTTKDTLFFSEKIFKPILVGHPFLIIGNMGSLSYLKKLGYKTFDKWVDESYDSEVDFLTRVDKVVSALDNFKYHSIKQLQIIRKDMQEVLDHNRKHLLASLKEKYGLPKGSKYIQQPLKPVKAELLKIFNSINYE